MQVSTVGLDLAKRVFQVHGIDAAGQVVVRRKLQRAQVANFFAGLPACLVGIRGLRHRPSLGSFDRSLRTPGATSSLTRTASLPPSRINCRQRKIGLGESPCSATNRMRERIASSENVTQQATVASSRCSRCLMRPALKFPRPSSLIVNTIAVHSFLFSRLITSTGAVPNTIEEWPLAAIP